MHDIKFIKENSKLFDDSLKKRKLSPQSKKLIKLEEFYLMLFSMPHDPLTLNL